MFCYAHFVPTNQQHGYQNWIPWSLNYSLHSSKIKRSYLLVMALGPGSFMASLLSYLQCWGSVTSNKRHYQINQKQMNKEDMIQEINDAILRGKYKNYCGPITLCMILTFIKRKFKINVLTQRELGLVAAWKCNKDDLSKQDKMTVRYIYYLVHVPFSRTEPIT